MKPLTRTALLGVQHEADRANPDAAKIRARAPRCRPCELLRHRFRAQESTVAATRQRRWASTEPVCVARYVGCPRALGATRFFIRSSGSLSYASHQTFEMAS